MPTTWRGPTPGEAILIEDARSELAEIIEEYVFVSLQEGHPLPEFKNFRKVA
jgi:predicted RNase H-like HicB family nuclease